MIIIGKSKPTKIIFLTKEMSFLSMKTYTKYRLKIYIRASKIPSNAQVNIICTLFELFQETKSKKVQNEKTSDIKNKILADKSFLFLIKTKDPSMRDMTIVGR
jgi:hypothetical protein